METAFDRMNLNEETSFKPIRAAGQQQQPDAKFLVSSEAMLRAEALAAVNTLLDVTWGAERCESLLTAVVTVNQYRVNAIEAAKASVADIDALTVAAQSIRDEREAGVQKFDQKITELRLTIAANEIQQGELNASMAEKREEAISSSLSDQKKSIRLKSEASLHEDQLKALAIDQEKIRQNLADNEEAKNIFMALCREHEREVWNDEKARITEEATAMTVKLKGMCDVLQVLDRNANLAGTV